ncbi:unnamed protein product [Echinostoma caproni]|uniref:Period circadian protein n=1 Tax=Echinostoma caproni TaxID=27848 RepID=A0A183A3Q5_9TREM|nr:unnamed protein product [Echinostoma caproni]
MGKSETNTPSATSSNSSDGGSKTIGKNLQAEPVKENSDYSGHPSNQNSANLSGSHVSTTLSSSVPTTFVTKSDSVYVAPNSQALPQQLPMSSTTSGSAAAAGANSSASQPRRRISDIVDKLRAKSSSSSSSTSGSGATSAGPDGPVAPEIDRSNPSCEPFETTASQSASGQSDQRGDNIFEKFCSSAPTPTDSKQSGQGDGAHRSPVFSAEVNIGQGSSSNQTSPYHAATDDGPVDGTTTTGNSDERPVDDEPTNGSTTSSKPKSKQYEVSHPIYVHFGPIWH